MPNSESGSRPILMSGGRPTRIYQVVKQGRSIDTQQGKKVCKATALRSCHCFPCTMLSVLIRANWSPPEKRKKKSYSAQLLTAAERCKNYEKMCWHGLHYFMNKKILASPGEDIVGAVPPFPHLVLVVKCFPPPPPLNCKRHIWMAPYDDFSTFTYLRD